MVAGERRAYWALVESVRTERGPRPKVVLWLGLLDQAGKVKAKLILVVVRLSGFCDNHKSVKFEYSLRPCPESRIFSPKKASVRLLGLN